MVKHKEEKKRPTFSSRSSHKKVAFDKEVQVNLQQYSSIDVTGVRI